MSTESLLSQLKDAEVGQRGYLLTNDRRYLQPYEQSIEIVNETVTRLKELTTDDPSQQQRLARINQLMLDRLEILRQTLELAGLGQIDQAKSIISIITEAIGCRAIAFEYAREFDYSKLFGDRIISRISRFAVATKFDSARGRRTSFTQTE